MRARDHEPGIERFIRFHRFPAVEPRIGPAIDLLHARRQRRPDIPQMIADLFAGRPVAVAQLAPDVFPRLGEKRQHRLIALLAFVLRVVAFAPAHLLPVQRVHGGVGVEGDDFQFHVGRLPDPFAQDLHHGQNLPGDIAMQGIHESPEGGLHRQLGDLQNARQDRVAGDEAQLIQSRKADVEASTIPSTNRYRSMARGMRFDVSVSSTRDWNPSFSSIVITGSSPP